MHITFKQVNIFLQAENKKSDKQKMKQEWPIGSTAETKQQKQVYLREQIIDAGYDPEQFIRFLNAKLDIDSDLDKCTIKDLEEVVVNYRQRKERQAEQLNSYFRERQTMNVQPTICQKSNSYQEPERVVIRTNPQLIQEQYKNVIKCVKITDKYQNKIKQISCQVNNPERKFFGGILGIGTTSYLCFDVWSYGLSKQPVCRRYSDFIWLRNTLLKFYPSEIIPPIPNKKAHKRLPRQIKKRMRILTMFLNDLIKITTLMNNKYVEGFLLIKDHSKFETMKEQAEKKKPYESMLSAQTLTGKVQLQISNKTVKYKDGLNRFVPQAEHLYKQITRNSKKMKNLTMQKINLLYEMANQFGDLYSISNKFNVYIKDDSTSKLNQIYAILNNMLVEWGNSLKKEMQEVEKNMCTFFKYVREEFMGFNQLMQRVQGCEQSWVKQKEVLEKQKQKIFLLKDPRKWELHKKDLQNLPKAAIYDRNQAFKIMLPKESVHVQTLKQNYAFYLSQLYQHGRENFDRCSERYCENFRQFSIKMKVSNQQIGAMWTEVSYKFSDPYKKPPVIQKMQMQKYQQSQNQSSGMYQD